MTPATPLLKVCDLHVDYGACHVLHGVDFSVDPGQGVALMGRNGMGKTTTIRSLFSLTPVICGEITVAGASITALPPHRIAGRGLALVPEGRGIFPSLNVAENLTMGTFGATDATVRWSKERVYDLFPRLAERKTHMGNQLSGGEQQMLAIGRALLRNPKLLVLDEASEGLAPLVREDIYRALKTVKKEGAAILIVDHHLSALSELCERAVVLSKGRVTFFGPTGKLAEDAALTDNHLGV